MLTIEDVTLSYGPIEAVRGVSFEVGEGAIIALLGRNGAGKTTTLSGIAGLNHPQKGTIAFGGRVISQLTPSKISRLGVAFVPEGRGVFGQLTVWENVAVAAYGHGMTIRRARTEIERAMSAFPVLLERTAQRAGSLSGGEQQMLAVARALVSHPKLLLVDEPGLGLAPIVVGALYKEFARLNADEGISILLVEQYVDLALRTAERAYVMEKGQIVTETVCGGDLSAASELVAAHIG
jgi:branched-chain amino acid transport system ATP-binding protein